ncbi:MAG: hypothetical protein ABEK29_07405, partial [Bradymonadaceae bacterium]
ASLRACGVEGEACKQCAEGFECSRGGDCVVPDGSRWDVVAVESTIVQSTVNVDRTSGPDQRLEMTVGDSSGKTSVAKDTYRATWNEVVVEGVRARGLKKEASYTPWDNDLHGQEKIVADCKPGFTDEDFANKKTSHTCIGGASARSRAEILFRLVPK